MHGTLHRPDQGANGIAAQTVKMSHAHADVTAADDENVGHCLHPWLKIVEWSSR
jgi:hypothetical protein